MYICGRTSWFSGSHRCRQLFYSLDLGYWDIFGLPSSLRGRGYCWSPPCIPMDVLIFLLRFQVGSTTHAFSIFLACHRNRSIAKLLPHLHLVPRQYDLWRNSEVSLCLFFHSIAKPSPLFLPSPTNKPPKPSFFSFLYCLQPISAGFYFLDKNDFGLIFGH